MSTPPPPPAPARPARIRRRPLKTQEDIRKALAATAADLEAGRITEARARTLGYLYQVLSAVHDRAELQAALDELTHEEPKP